MYTDGQKCCIFQEEKNEDLTQRPTNSTEYHYGCYTMIATIMQYFSSMPSSGSFVMNHTRLIKGGWSTEEEQCTSARQMYQVTGCSSLWSLSWLLRWDWKQWGRFRGRIVVWESQTSESLAPLLVSGLSILLLIQLFEKANFNLYCQSLTELIPFLFAKNNVNYAKYNPVLFSWLS